MKSISWVLAAAFVAGVMGVSSCGGSSGSGGSCGAVQPCGGSIVGTWKADQVCIVDASLLGIDATAICSTAKIEFTSITATGTETYNADLTYQTSGTATIGLKITVPTSCFQAGMACADLDAELKMQMQQDTSIKSAACATSGTACVCNEMVVSNTPESGTYTATGTDLTTTATGQTASTDQYCVQGNTLHDIIIDMSMPMGSMGTVKIAGDFVLTKQ